ncbi:AIR synthase-related protein [Candidatus Bathyarchaeota archaeon]|nr:AIR synthase-related protein [Candidatus Bathyarchaeota archaeon]
MGKLAVEELRKLLGCIKKDPRVIVPPTIGYDAGVHLIGNKYLAVATDPCIDVPEEWFGWLLINYAASDVALFGAKPECCTVALLGSRSTKPQIFQRIMQQACGAADELAMAIVGGHTGTYDKVTGTLGVCTAYGAVAREKLVTPKNINVGDHILCTKSIGLETVVNFSLMHRALAEKLFGTEQAKRLSKLVRLQSCVNEALQLSTVGGVHAMHDATEGGLVAALNELAENAHLGFEVDFEKIPISTEARTLQQSFGLTDEQVLAMSSTGTILAAVHPQDKEEVEEILRKNGLSASFLGVFTKNRSCILMKNQQRTRFPKDAEDPYANILSAQA